MPECCGCVATDNLRPMDIGPELEAELGGPQYICRHCDDDASEMLAEFRSTPV